jgi:hypothetical protein
MRPPKAIRSEDELWCVAAFLGAGFDDFSAGDALRPGETGVDAEGLAQHDDEEDSDESADEQDHDGFPVMVAQVGPEAGSIDFGQHE